jgi:lysophospholipase L1-like esterase
MAPLKILILSDSLPLARTKPEVCKYNDTWPTLLKQQGHHIHQVSIGGATSSDLLKQVHYHDSFHPDIVLIQVGIVDCAPRVFNKKEINILNMLGVINRKIIKPLTTKYDRKLRVLRNQQFTSEKIFKKNILSFLQHYQSSKLFFIPIIKANKCYIKQLPNIEENITAYNKIIEETASQEQTLSLASFDVESCLMSDNHHLNTKGHRAISHIIEEVLND